MTPKSWYPGNCHTRGYYYTTLLYCTLHENWPHFVCSFQVWLRKNNHVPSLSIRLMQVWQNVWKHFMSRGILRSVSYLSIQIPHCVNVAMSAFLLTHAFSREYSDKNLWFTAILVFICSIRPMISFIEVLNFSSELVIQIKHSVTICQILMWLLCEVWFLKFDLEH